MCHADLGNISSIGDSSATKLDCGVEVSGLFGHPALAKFGLGAAPLRNLSVSLARIGSGPLAE